MNAFLYHLVSGAGWFSCGMYFVGVAFLDAIRLFDTRPRYRRVTHFFMVLAIPLAAMTGTPMKLWLAVLLVMAVCGYAAFAFTNKNLTFRRISAALSCVLVICGMAFEIPWYFKTAPRPGVPPSNLYVLGDSLSAGGYGETQSWPKIIETSSDTKIHDLSFDGAMVGTVLTGARDALENAPQANTVVFIELGGNDMLGNTSAAAFYEALDRVLRLSRGDPSTPRTVVMMELPILFGKWSFGMAQRRLARLHGVALVPKRILADVVLSRGYTGPDGLHLSQSGHTRFAEIIRPWVGLDVSKPGTS